MVEKPGGRDGEDVDGDGDEERGEQDGESDDSWDQSTDERDVAEQVDDGREEGVDAEDHADEGQDSHDLGEAFRLFDWIVENLVLGDVLLVDLQKKLDGLEEFCVASGNATAAAVGHFVVLLSGSFLLGDVEAWKGGPCGLSDKGERSGGAEQKLNSQCSLSLRRCAVALVESSGRSWAEIEVLAVGAWRAVIPASIAEDSLGVFEGGSEGGNLAALVGDFLADVVASEVDLLIVDGVALDEPVGGVVEPLALVLAVGGDPVEIVVGDVAVSLLPRFLPPLQNLHYPGDLDEVGSVHAREIVSDDSTSPGLSVGVDQLVLLASGRRLAGHVHSLADLSAQLQAPAVDGCPFLVEPDAYQRAEEEDGS